MASTIVITFSDFATSGDTINLFDPVYNTLTGLETFKSQRINNFEVSLPDISDPNYNIILAQNYAQAFQVDYDQTDLFEVQINDAVVTIQADEDNVFDGYTISNSFATATVSTTPNVTSLVITNVSYLENPTDKCAKVLVRIDANIEFTEIFEPIRLTQTAATFIEFEYSRALSYAIDIRTSDNKVAFRASLFQSTPVFITGNLLEISEDATPQGVNISVDYARVTPVSVRPLTFSLDNVTFQTSNTFSGLLNGTYNVYAKDPFGCVVSSVYVIGDFQPGQNSAPPYFYISPSNPLPFTLTRDIVPNENYNADNLIAQNQLNYPAFNYLCPFKPSDSILSVQVKSSFVENTAKLVDCNGTEIDTAPFQVKTSNIGAFESRDAFKYRGIDLRLRVFFTNGNTYNEAGGITGSYNLNGNYPDAYKVGSYIRVDSSYEVITDIVYNLEFERWEIVTANNLISALSDTAIIASTYYNIQPYEVYEIAFDISNLDGVYQIILEYGTSANPTLGSAFSEAIEVSDSHEKNHLFVYGSSENNDIVWSTGFIGRFRVPYDIYPVYAPSDEIDTYQSDSKLIQLESRVYDQFNFSFYGIPYRVVEQISKVLVNNVIFIDGMQLAKNSTPEIEAIGASNLYKMNVTLQKLEVFDNVNQIYNPYALNTIPDYAVGSYVITNGLFLDSNGFVIDE